jgi:quinol monooxygenase YgiN
MSQQKVSERVKSRLEEARKRLATHMKPLRVVSRLVAQPDRIDRLKVVLHSLVEPVRQEPGCLAYDLLQNQDAPREFVVIQQWASREQYDAHMASQHMYDAMAQMDNMDLLAELPDIRFYYLVA